MFSTTGPVVTAVNGSTSHDSLRHASPWLDSPWHESVGFGRESASSARLLSRAASLALFCSLLTLCGLAQVSVTTYHNTKQRTGTNLLETTLTPANVNPENFGKLFSQPVDGFLYAQPLYVSNVPVAGHGVHNVVYVATMNDSVYAFDADNRIGANSKPLWQASFIDSDNGITPVPTADIACGDMISSKIGIMSTPVIDTVFGTLYVLARTKENGAYVQRLHALDITSGAEKFGGPVVIAATASGTGAGSVNGTITFDPKIQNQRAALLLQNGLIYIAWGSHCDLGTYHGWLMAYDYKLLVQRAVWLTTPDGVDGAIWESGSGPSADATSIYLPVANGTFDANTGGNDYGQSIVKLSAPTAGAFTVQDYFTPFNGPNLNNGDWDIGSGGAMLLPDQPLGPNLHLLVQSDKKGTIYLVNRDNMGQYNPQNNRQIVQNLPNANLGMWNSPAWWSNHLYFGGSMDYLKAFAFNPGKGLIASVPTSQTSKIFNYPGTTPVVSSNQLTNPILWALDNSMFKAPNGNAVLYAYDATNLATELYDSAVNPTRDNAGAAVKFTVPIVANGKVYVGTRTRLSVYGLLPTAAVETAKTYSATTRTARTRAARMQTSPGSNPKPVIATSEGAEASALTTVRSKIATSDNP